MKIQKDGYLPRLVFGAFALMGLIGEAGADVINLCECTFSQAGSADVSNLIGCPEAGPDYTCTGTATPIPGTATMTLTTQCKMTTSGGSGPGGFDQQVKQISQSVPVTSPNLPVINCS